MWKKDDVTDPAVPKSNPNPSPTRTGPDPSNQKGKKGATIGPSITVNGEVSGNEDLLIQGRVEGSVDLKDQSVTVGEDGRVKANIDGRIVTIEGEVEGNLHALEQVVLRSTARVQGDITAPRVVLEDGATFRGLVDMGAPSGSEVKRKADSSAPPATTRIEPAKNEKTGKNESSSGSAAKTAG